MSVSAKAGRHNRIIAACLPGLRSRSGCFGGVGREAEAPDFAKPASAGEGRSLRRRQVARGSADRFFGMSEIVFLVEDAPDGGFTARALAASIFTEADSLDALREAVRDAVAWHYAAAERPKLIRLHFVRDEVITA